MKPRPIIFSTDMVYAILEGRKLQTRRMLKIGIPVGSIQSIGYTAFTPEGHISLRGDLYKDGEKQFGEWFMKCPYGKTGDMLWVRETWANLNVDFKDVAPYFVYRANYADHGPVTWKPSIHMPWIACRLLLEVEAIRVERLHDITEADARAEGVQSFRPVPGDGDPITLFRDYMAEKRYDSGGLIRKYRFRSAVESFQSLWVSINGQEYWDKNPWVWVITFKNVTPQIY